MPQGHDDSVESEKAPIGSRNFTQSFLKSPLLKVRVWLVVAGILMILFFGLRLPTARAWVEDEVRRALLDLPKAQVDRAVLFEQWRAALSIGLGFIFIALGIMLKDQPLPVAVLCLLVYFIFQAAVAFLKPPGVLGVVVGQVLTAIALVMAGISAFRYQSDDLIPS
jgi:hypothetical protein